jgi:hypothetical protein
VPVLVSLVAVPAYAVALPVLLVFGQHVFMRYLIRNATTWAPGGARCPQENGPTALAARVTRKAVTAVALMVASTVVAVLLCEAGSRWIVDPVDYLSPTLVRDDVLGMRITPGSGGHDEWGFRNRRVPDSAEVVALGDSHTYGNTAKMDEVTWSPFSARDRETRPNLGMGGYGPNRMITCCGPRRSSLSRRRSSAPVPRRRLRQRLSHHLRVAALGLLATQPRLGRSGHLGEAGPADLTWHRRVRHGSQHSILYQLVFHGVLQTSSAAIRCTMRRSCTTARQL